MTLKQSITGLIVLFPLLYSNLLSGQEKSKSPIQFHGTDKVYGQYFSLQGGDEISPPSYVRDDLQMTLSVYDVPVSASFFLTSEQNGFKQSINNFRMYLDVAALKRRGLEKATALVTSQVPGKLLKAKDDVVKSKDLLSSLLTDDKKTQDLAQAEYEKAKKRYADTTSAKNLELITKAKAKLDVATAKVKEVENKLKRLKAKLDQANAAIQQAKSIAKSPQQLTGTATSFAKGAALSKMGRFLSIFPTLEVGKCRPNYSELILQGIALSGVNIEMNPGLFYAAFAMGKVKRAIDINSTADPAYKRDLLLIRLGVGKKNESHLYFSYMRIQDQAGSLKDSLVRDSLYIYPHSNHILAAEAKLSFFKNRFTIEGEAAASVYTNDTQTEGFDLKDTDIPSWLVSYMKVNVSSSFDFAYTGKIGLNLKTTTITAGIKKIGAGYRTLGNPNLIGDRMIYNGRIDQSFAKHQVNIALFGRYSTDNLSSTKSATTKMLGYGITASLRLTKAPYFMVSYMPNFQKTNGEFIKQENSAYMINALAGYFYKIGKLGATTNIMFCRQYGNLVRDTAKDLSMTNSYSLNQDFSLVIPLSISLGANYSESRISGKDENLISLMLKGTYSAFKDKWQNSLGINWSDQNNDQNKLGFFLNSRVQLWKGGNLEIQLEKNTFRDNIQCVKSFKEFIARLTFEVRW